METAYIQVYANGYWQQVSSCPLSMVQQDLESWKKTFDDPVRAVDSHGRIVGM